MDGMDIWIVTSGSYSDYRIEGVFSTKDLADSFADKIGGEVDVDEWCVDVRCGEIMRCLYHCRIGMPSKDTFMWVDHQMVDADDRSLPLPDISMVYDNAAYGSSYVSEDEAKRNAIEAWSRHVKDLPSPPCGIL